jgi:hypothetical protein
MKKKMIFIWLLMLGRQGAGHAPMLHIPRLPQAGGNLRSTTMTPPPARTAPARSSTSTSPVAPSSPSTALQKYHQTD